MKFGNPLQGNRNLTLWFISFGDLLTLFLCFFIATITFHHSQTMQALEMKESERGTQIAPIGSEVLSSEGLSIDELYFKPEHFEAGEEAALAASLGAKLRSLKEMAGSELREILVSACDSRSHTNETGSWDESTARVLALRSQFVDIAPEAVQLRLEALGPDCERIRDGAADGKADSSIARIRFGYQRVQHG